MPDNQPLTDNDLLAAFESLDDVLDHRETYKRIPFSYAGTKSESLPEILPRLPVLNTFVDVFGGSGVVILNRQVSKLDVYNDLSSGLTCFFRVVRDPTLLQKLLNRIPLTPHGREEYLWSKQTWESCDDAVERAARWYVTIQSSFAGLGRNFGRALKGKGTMWRNIQERLDLFNDVAERFLTIQVENLDWRHCLKDYDSLETVFYVDPPYWSKNVYPHQMSRTEHVELCERIFQCKGFVALSGYDTDLYKTYPWHDIHSWKINDYMASQAYATEENRLAEKRKHGRGHSTEYLYIKEIE